MGNAEKVAQSKKRTQFKTTVQKPRSILDKNDQIDNKGFGNWNPGTKEGGARLFKEPPVWREYLNW